MTTTELEAFGRELDRIGADIKSSLGARDRRYILRLIRLQRALALAGRVAIFGSLPFIALGPLFFAVIAAGVLLLASAKILENMEIGHNVLHGQWDWMRDPEIHSSTWEWDNVCPAAQWKHSHNYLHHTFTNVIGKDRDIGYDVLRVTEAQPWHPRFVLQPLYNLAIALFFEWGVAVHDVDVTRPLAESRHLFGGIGRKVARQVAKDYLLWPLLAGPFFLVVLAANGSANLVRNLWAYAIIFCGHFPDGAETFPESALAGETRARWYLRQIRGSCNIDGGPLFHLMSGNLSYQIEHHLFPDLPSNRYREIAPRVRALCARYGVAYNTGSFWRQLASTTRKIWRLSLPSPA